MNNQDSSWDYSESRDEMSDCGVIFPFFPKPSRVSLKKPKSNNVCPHLPPPTPKCSPSRGGAEGKLPSASQALILKLLSPYPVSSPQGCCEGVDTMRHVFLTSLHLMCLPGFHTAVTSLHLTMEHTLFLVANAKGGFNELLFSFGD